MQVDQLCQALMPTGVRNLRGMLHATAVEVLLVSEMLVLKMSKALWIAGCYAYLVSAPSCNQAGLSRS